MKLICFYIFVNKICSFIFILYKIIIELQFLEIEGEERFHYANPTSNVSLPEVFFHALNNESDCFAVQRLLDIIGVGL